MSITLPARSAVSLRPGAASGLVVGSAAIATIFAATTFAIPATITTFDVGAGTAALISTAQVGGFTLTNLIGGRRLQPTAQLARGSLLVMTLANAASIVPISFAALVALRFVAGLAMGLVTWIAWSDSADDPSRKGKIAAIGPLTSAIAAPVIAVAVSGGGLGAIYGLLTVVAALGLLFPISVNASIGGGRRPIEAKGVIPVLIGMGALTCGGSAVFVFAGVIARDNIGMSNTTLSIALALNALVGIPAARYADRRRFPGIFIMLTGLCAVLLVRADSTWLFTAIVTVWGLTFWLAVPETYSLLSDRSKHAADRIGDAQAVMAVGRVIGPTLGGLLVATGSFNTLGLVAGAIMITGGVLVTLVSTSHRRQSEG